MSKVQKHYENEEIRERAKNWRYNDGLDDDPFRRAYAEKSSKSRPKPPKQPSLDELIWDEDGNLIIQQNNKSYFQNGDNEQSQKKKSKTKTYAQQHEAAIRLSRTRKATKSQQDSQKGSIQSNQNSQISSQSIQSNHITVANFEAFYKRQFQASQKRNHNPSPQKPKSLINKNSQKLVKNAQYESIFERQFKAKKDDNDNGSQDSYVFTPPVNNPEKPKVKSSRLYDIKDQMERKKQKEQKIKEEIEKENLAKHPKPKYPVYKSEKNGSQNQSEVGSPKESVAEQRKRIQQKAREMAPIILEQADKHEKPKRYPLPDFVQALNDIIKLEDVTYQDSD